MTISRHYIKYPTARFILALITIVLAFELNAAGAIIPAESDSGTIKKVLFIGDSMTGWMAERLNAYAGINDFEVATIVWDGSTISKWANSPNLEEIISSQAPDAIIVSLGMNEMFEQNPQAKLNQPTEALIEAFGEIPFLWIGPPSWPGKEFGGDFNDWMEKKLGKQKYFRSSDLDLPRQSQNNPHPSRPGIERWIDKVVEWIPENSGLVFRSLTAPEPGKMSRGETFIYKRIKDEL